MERSLTIGLALLLAIPASAQSRPVWVIGGENAVGSELGEYRKVAVLPRHIIVLERDAPFLKVFSHQGKLLQTLGRAGSGPSEYRSPFDIAYDSAQRRLLVVDPANRRVTSYPVGDTIGPPRLLGLENVSVRGTCMLRGKLYGIVRSAKIITEMSEQGDQFLTASDFGEPRTNHPLGGHPLVGTRASDGPLFCDNASNRLIAASRLLGEIHIIDGTSRTQQTTLIPSFRRIDITVDNTTLTMSIPPAGHDALIDIVHFGDTLYGVLELVKRGEGRTMAPPSYRTVVIDRNGPSRTLSTSKAWRPIALLGARALCSSGEPVPTIALFDAARCP
jgi:hypothetical protein